MPLNETIVGGVLHAGGGTRAWDDLEASDDISLRAREHGWRAMITTIFSAGGATYVLTFTASAPTARPFGSQDRAFIEVLAAFFSAHYQQRWQTARLGHQLEHNLLTDLWNRTRFRSYGRTAFEAHPRAALAVVDLAQFHDFNEANGHLNGDAILVEVAAALTAKTKPGEVVARIGSNAFAIFIPDAPAREDVLTSVARFGSVFDRELGIGDRDGTKTLPVSARIGFARSAQDAASFDDLLLCAEGRARASSLHASRRMFPARP